ncbi:hypothetical protein [Echinicola vietnamensis]|uniref:Integral membrane protein n=1 Tax=Echinicola vietnamensis (strain DSM 17526 / LMG 23754 / KMM 6221) TaxID=926556 RepID=L0G7J4_ECHVK|nr:hypothetical protein [Echinicola vietnamensis]AGA80825.1 hypothetical protein Echvi_4658 [Echinicola vietnamensis DSM 17526]
MTKLHLNKLIERGYDFDIQTVLVEGWSLFKQQPLFAVGYTGFVISLELLFLLYLKEYALLFSVFLAGPLFSGFYLVANKLKAGEHIAYTDFFQGFTYYIPIILIWLIGQILVSLGLVLFVVPGVYLMVGYSLSILLHIFAGLDFWESLEYSRKIVTKNWWKFFLLVLSLILINIIGALVFVGVFVTIPVSFFTAYCAFEAVTGDVLVEEVEEV